MSSVENLREFVNERITAAAEEIFGVFKAIVVEYEQEIERQRRLLNVVWKPDIKLHRIELPQKHVCTEEKGVCTDQQLCNQERSSSLDQEEPDAQIKEEEEKLCTSQEGELLVLKLETDTPAYGKSGHNGVKTLYFHPDKSQNSAQTELPVLCISWVKKESDQENIPASESNSDKEVLSMSSQAAESQDQDEDKRGDSGLTEITEPKKRRCQNKSCSKNISDCSLPDIDCISCNDKKSFKCGSCPQAFKFKSGLQRHQRRHTGEKPFSCNSCGRRFSRKSELKIHLRIHTGEKPYSCDTCELSFCRKSELNIHMRIHTGEKPYSCKTCQKDFRFASELRVHLRNHTGIPQPSLSKNVDPLDLPQSDRDISISLEHVDPEPPLIKEELHELSTGQGREQIVLGQETEAFKLSPTYDKSEDSEDQTLFLDPSQTQSVAENEHQSNILDGWMQCEFDRNKSVATEPQIGCDQHGRTGSSQHMCTLCGKNFKIRRSLKFHMKIHTGEKLYCCKYCGKEFAFSSSMSRHLRVHTGEKPYECSLCGKRFNVSTTLKVHYRIHTGEKPYKCKTCEKAFTTCSNLKKHTSLHTKVGNSRQYEKCY